MLSGGKGKPKAPLRARRKCALCVAATQSCVSSRCCGGKGLPRGRRCRSRAKPRSKGLRCFGGPGLLLRLSCPRVAVLAARAMRPARCLARTKRKCGWCGKQVWRRACCQINRQDQRDAQQGKKPNHRPRDARAHAATPCAAAGRNTHARSFIPITEPANAATIQTQP
jgi:hypothetical protein